MKRILILIIFLLSVNQSVAQSKFLIGNARYKPLPLELSLSYQNPDYLGIRIGLENAIIVKNSMDVVLGKPVYSKKEVLTRLDLRNLLYKFNAENHHEIQLGFSTSYRRTFQSGLVLEPILGYQYGFSYNIKSMDRLSHKHEMFIQMGLGYTSALKELSNTIFYIRPGFSLELYNEVEKEFQFIVDLGVQFRVPYLKVKRWRNPLFSKKKKPNVEFEFLGSKAGDPSDKNNKEKKRQRLNKKRRKYRTGKKKMKSKKKKK